VTFPYVIATRAPWTCLPTCHREVNGN